jgi:hypothetical protein
LTSGSDSRARTPLSWVERARPALGFCQHFGSSAVGGCSGRGGSLWCARTRQGCSCEKDGCADISRMHVHLRTIVKVATRISRRNCSSTVRRCHPFVKSRNGDSMRTIAS